MPISRFNTKAFHRLDAKWQEKLRAEKFPDIECANRDRPLKKPFPLNSKKTIMFDSVQEYFLQASHYLIEGKFNTITEKKVWALHAEGDSLAEIGKKIDLSKSCVRYHVDKIKKLVKVHFKCKKLTLL